MEKYIIRDTEAGNVIEKAESMAEALEIIACYEEDYKAEGTYTPNFYEVVEAEVVSEENDEPATETETEKTE